MQNSKSRYTFTTVWETEVKCLTVPNAANNERVDPARGRECQQSARVPWVRETRVRVMAVGVIETEGHGLVEETHGRLRECHG